MEQKFFHVSFIILFVLILAIRAYCHRLAIKYAGKTEFKEKRLMRAIIGVPFVLLLVKYMIDPGFFVWARLDMPAWLQWLGFALGTASIPITVWIHANLGINFSSVLHVREKHTLSTTGPYKWVRHPMYTVLFMHFLGILFLTENLFIGGVSLLGFIIIIAGRLKNEERLMLETFGDDYRRYMERTGRFLPKF
ncbi:MAG: isoprenylcysteine carboxylmethyltransferase family protein [Candidatus Taylorbacteria bacterium]|nr:isoprenylcysteine carboxylmethyltransferase family protein [Candidatus Taylorbacteria bacterium]